MWNNSFKDIGSQATYDSVPKKHTKMKWNLWLSNPTACSFHTIVQGEEKTQEDPSTRHKFKRSWRLKKAKIAKVHRQSNRREQHGRRALNICRWFSVFIWIVISTCMSGNYPQKRPSKELEEPKHDILTGQKPFQSSQAIAEILIIHEYWI